MATRSVRANIASAVSVSKKTRKRRPGRPTAAKGPGLTLERVVAAAADLVHREGFDAVNVRRLAAELGVWAGAVSHHAPSKDDLLDKVADSLLAQCPVEFPDRIDWRKRLRVVVTSLADIAHANPGFSDWAVTRVSLAKPGPGGRAVAQVYVDIFLRAGLKKAQANKAAVVGHALTLGAIKLADAVRRGGASNEEGRWPVEGADGHFVSFSASEIIDACLDHLIAAVEAQVK